MNQTKRKPRIDLILTNLRLDCGQVSAGSLSLPFHLAVHEFGQVFVETGVLGGQRVESSIGPPAQNLVPGGILLTYLPIFVQYYVQR